MKISKLNISNFRGIKESTLYFDSHTLLVGRNNIGKSTICEALDLVLGPEAPPHALLSNHMYLVIRELV